MHLLYTGGGSAAPPAGTDHSYRAEGAPGPGRACRAGRGRQSQVRRQDTPAAVAASSSDGTTEETDGHMTVT